MLEKLLIIEFNFCLEHFNDSKKTILSYDAPECLNKHQHQHLEKTILEQGGIEIIRSFLI